MIKSIHPKRIPYHKEKPPKNADISVFLNSFDICLCIYFFPPKE